MEPINRLIENNKDWAAATQSVNPNFFKDLQHEQKPEYLWIGCSDSRVPGDILTGMHPGSMFVQRNIANMVIHTDLNLLSVLEWLQVLLKEFYLKR